VRHLRWALTLGMSVACMSVPSLALDQFIQDKEEGWFWYEIEPEPKEPKSPEPLPPPKPVESQVIKLPPPKPEEKKPEGLSVEWFQKEYPSVLNQAIDNPTPENVSTYRYTTRVMLDKASNFAHEFKRQALMDPLLDESNRYPFSSAARGTYQRFTIEQKRSAIKGISGKAGLWVFLDQSCPFCALQYPIVARTARERGFLVTYITPDGARPDWIAKEDDVVKDEGQSKVLKIGIRPATVLVIPPERITVLTQGMLSQDLLEERILMAGDMAGLLNKEDHMRAFPMDKGLLTPDDIREAGKSMTGGSKDITPKVQELLEKRN